MAFSDTQDSFEQEHFTIIEIDLPVVNGTCTIGGSDGFGTPLTCDQDSNGTFTHKFTMVSAPLLQESNIWRCIKSISETPTELNSGRGLASRGTVSISIADFIGDPNPNAPAVTEEIASAGSFFGKLDARNILQNKPIRIKNYRVVNGELPDLDNDAEVRHYIIDTFQNNGKGKWTIRAKDELSRFNLQEKVYPEEAVGFLRLDINTNTTNIPVSDSSLYSVNDVLRIGDELMIVSAIVDSDNITVRARGSAIGAPVFNNTLSRFENPSAHDAGDEIFVCKVFDGANVADFLSDIVQSGGVDSSLIPISDWYAEVNEWHATTTVKALYTESNDINEVLSQALQSFLLDMWFDPVDREIKLSAISVWKDSSTQLTEGVEIDYDSVKRSDVESLRATNALVVYDKPFKTKDDATENYKKASLFTNPVLETDDLYGEPKDKRFDNNPIIDTDAANLLVQRYVSRYGITPRRYTWKTQEKNLTFSVGQVVDMRTSARLSASGAYASGERGQVISIKPNYNGIGRDYTVTALTYEPAFNEGSEIVITGNVSEINLYTQYAGAPSQAVNLTFIFDGTKSGSNTINTPSIRAGAFPSGSKLTIILANGADLQCKGGNGGTSGGAYFDTEFNAWRQTPALRGGAGGIVFDADGVDCDIYFSGTTPSTTYPNADGYIRASGGGGGSNNATVPTQSGDSGGGGAGRTGGNGGDTNPPLNELPLGAQGGAGSDNGVGGSSSAAGNGGGWGQQGQSATSLGGDAGKGIVDSGATVVLYGATATRYINGNGDH